MFSAKTLEVIFLVFVIFAIVRMLFIKLHESKQKDINKVYLFMIGAMVGVMSRYLFLKIKPKPMRN